MVYLQALVVFGANISFWRVCWVLALRIQNQSCRKRAGQGQALLADEHGGVMILQTVFTRKLNVFFALCSK